MLEKKIFAINNEYDFERIALEVFLFQYKNNNIYQRFVNYLGVEPKKVEKISQIPFLPIDFFKNHRIIHNNFEETITFVT